MYDITDADAIYLLYAVSALGYSQIVNRAMHKHGNTLDLIFTSEESSLKFTKTKVSDMLCDHRFVLTQLEVSRTASQLKEVIYRKFTLGSITSLQT